jgi:uncharacterized ion transporter superfamily protein YfcC
MTSKMLSAYIIMLLIVLTALVMSGILPAGAAESKKPEINIQDDMQAVGIINPDGAKSVWLISSSRGGDIPGLLAKYLSKMIDGLKFYEVSSWRAIVGFLTVVNEQQAQMVRKLAQNMQKLNKRVGNLEKKRLRKVSFRSSDHRIRALEKKVDYMSDGGHP